MNNSNFTEIVQAGLNNPDCSFYTGAFVGHWSAISNLITLLMIYLAFKMVDKLIFKKIIVWIENKFKRSKNE